MPTREICVFGLYFFLCMNCISFVIQSYFRRDRTLESETKSNIKEWHYRVTPESDTREWHQGVTPESDTREWCGFFSHLKVGRRIPWKGFCHRPWRNAINLSVNNSGWLCLWKCLYEKAKMVCAREKKDNEDSARQCVNTGKPGGGSRDRIIL